MRVSFNLQPLTSTQHHQ